jgi:hypothetical protein
MPLIPGTRLGSYEITSQLGSGGMGRAVCQERFIVYAKQHLEDLRQVLHNYDWQNPEPRNTF